MPNIIQQKARLIPLSAVQQHVPYTIRHLRNLCVEGKLATAIKPNGERGKWFVERQEIEQKFLKRPDGK